MLVTTICRHCHAWTRHRHINEARVHECSKCGTANVLRPYDSGKAYTQMAAPVLCINGSDCDSEPQSLPVGATFKEYLEAHENVDSPIGDLARDIAWDRSALGTTLDTPGQILSRLALCHASEQVMSNYQTALDAYKAAQ